MVDLKRRHARLSASVEQAAVEVLRSGQWVGGEKVGELESQMATLFSRQWGVGVGSGTDGLVMALQALGIGTGHRVAVPAVSFFATVGAVLAVGATPVFVDILEDRPQMDPDKLTHLKNLDAVMAVDLFGMYCPLPKLDIPVVRDSAQAAGWNHPKPPAEAVCVSLYPTKTIGGAGDGGVVLCDDSTLAERIRALGNHGRVAPHIHARIQEDVAPGTSRLDAIQAAIALVHLTDIHRRVQRRRAIATIYEQHLGHLSPLPRHPADALQRFVLQSPRREPIRSALSAQGIQSDCCYPLPLDAQPFFTQKSNPVPADSAHPNAQAYCEQAFSLPCHAELSDEDVHHVIDVVSNA
ncbi:MAG: DegT/DnrJ/EryC1/StrS family aminotransferase [Myxococcota bacterium]|nr:DegT/DnrJ/EryC1/StrS family aminotransferase [Myxococcota bacterium]